MKRVSFKDVGLKYLLSPYDEPVVYVKAGEVFVLEVEDACSGQIRKARDCRDRKSVPFGNPVVGPIHIEGVEKGSTMGVSVEEIKSSIGQGAAYFSEFSENYMMGSPIFKFIKIRLPRDPKICKIYNGLVHFNKIVIPYQPMIGTIGVAPNPEVSSMSSSVLPGRHGGNMDLADVAPKSTISLPVFHDGGLLYIGDVHATQGDGEISGTAVEMPAEVKVKVDLHEGEHINWPRIETGSEVMCVTTASVGRGLEDAIITAFFELAVWMEEKYGLNRFDGLMLLSQVGKIRIGNLWTVAARIGKDVLSQLK